MANTDHAYPYAQPLRDLTPAAAVAFALAALVTVLDLGTTVLLTPALADDSDSNVLVALGAAGVVSGLALLGAAVAGAVWLHLARDNSERYEPGYHHARGKVWIWLGWWVPIVSFWFPYQLVRDVQQSVTKWSNPLIGYWWGLWLASIIWGRITGASIDAAAAGQADVATAQVVAAIGTALTLAALVCWGLVLRLVTTTQSRARRGEKVAIWEDSRSGRD